MQQKGLKNIQLLIRLYVKKIMIAKLPIYSNRENLSQKIIKCLNDFLPH